MRAGGVALHCMHSAERLVRSRRSNVAAKRIQRMWRQHQRATPGATDAQLRRSLDQRTVRNGLRSTSNSPIRRGDAAAHDAQTTTPRSPRPPRPARVDTSVPAPNEPLDVEPERLLELQSAVRRAWDSRLEATRRQEEQARLRSSAGMTTSQEGTTTVGGPAYRRYKRLQEVRQDAVSRVMDWQEREPERTERAAKLHAMLRACDQAVRELQHWPTLSQVRLRAALR